jgi:diguanylate cyclase (GGDEF)-like protein
VISWIKQSVSRQAGVIVAFSLALATCAVWWLGKLAFIPTVPARNFLVTAACAVPAAGVFAAWVAERLLGSRLAHLVEVIDGAGPHDDLARIRNLGEDEVGAIGQAVNRLLARITSIRASMIDQERELGKAQRELQLRTDLAEKTKELATRLEERAMLFDILRMTTSSPELDEVMRALVVRVGQLLHLREVVFFTHQEETREFVVRAAHGFAEGAQIVGRSLKIGEGISGNVGKTREPLVIADLSQVAEYQGFWGLSERKGSLAAVPVTYQDRLLGVLTVTRPEQEPITDVQLRLLCAIADNAALAIRNAQLFEHMRTLNTHDELTGLPNRKLLRTQLESEVDRARRFDLPFAVIVVDVDQLGAFNAANGAAHGDAALREIADILSSSLRKVDTVARAGDDEFVLLLPRTDLKEAIAVAEKLRRSVLALQFLGADIPARKLGISLGVAQLLAADDESGRTILGRAEQAVAAAKSAGRNRVFVADGASTSAALPPS